MRTFAYLVAIALVSCASPTPAPADDDAQAFSLCFPSGWSWPTEIGQSVDEYRGAPAWANDGSNLAMGVWQGAERMRPGSSDDPCAWEKRKYAWQLFTVTPGASIPAPNANAWQAGEAVELYYMKSAGYALVKVFDESRTRIDYVRAPLNGGPTENLGSQVVYQGNPVDYRGRVRDLVPSPDGRLAADVVCHATDENADGSYRLVAHPDCTVRFLDMTRSPVAQVGASWSLTLAAPLAWYPSAVGDLSRQMDRVMWTHAGALVVTDHVSSAFSVDPTQGVTSATLPSCGGPNTASSKISSSSSRLGVKHHLFVGDRVEVVPANTYTSTFGCL